MAARRPASPRPAEPTADTAERGWWPRLRPWLFGAFAVLVATLLVRQARDLDWQEVWTAVQRLQPTTLALAAGLTVLSHLIYSQYDLVGRHQLGLTLPPRRMMGVTAVSYAFNLNLGSLIGGFAFRYRLYARLGLSPAEVTQVLGLSMLTNWLGWGVVAGTCFLLGLVRPPPSWGVAPVALQVLGGVLCAVAVAYLIACMASRRRTWHVRGHELTLPRTRVALIQFLLSVGNWMVIGAVLHTLMPTGVAYPAVLGALMVSAIAGVITHIPAGLGVIEAVCLALLGGQIGHGTLLASLLAYRAVYYLAPLALAIVGYLRLEAVATRGEPDEGTA